MLRRIYFWFMEVVLDRHICKEFTQWEEKIFKLSRCPINHYEQEVAEKNEIGRITFTNRVQERQCTICGKIEQRKIGDVI